MQLSSLSHFSIPQVRSKLGKVPSLTNSQVYFLFFLLAHVSFFGSRVASANVVLKAQEMKRVTYVALYNFENLIFLEIFTINPNFI